jgi:hypothetical protein
MPETRGEHGDRRPRGAQDLGDQQAEPAVAEDRHRPGAADAGQAYADEAVVRPSGQRDLDRPQLVPAKFERAHGATIRESRAGR